MNADSNGDAVFQSGMALLARYADGPDVASTRHDPGPLLLAAAAASVGTVPAELRVRVTRRWLSECPERVFAFGAFGGLGGLLCGLRAARDWLDQETSGGLMDALAAEAPRWARAAGWRTAAPAWADYDLFHGPAGLLLGGLEAGSDGTVFEPALGHLVTLFDTVGLDRIQATVFEWNAASERVLVKAGYRHEGRLRRHVRKDGELGDAALYATVREDHERRSP